jgi:hypothetical protein
MNSLIRDYMERTLFPDYQLRRNELTDLLSDTDLSFRPGPATLSLGELCREMGEVEHSYIDALKTFRQDFDWRSPDPAVIRSVARLAAWYADLDRELLAALEALSDADVENGRIIRSDWAPEVFSPTPRQELDIYREAMVIFYGKASIYLRLMGRELPGDWRGWIG